MTLPGGMAFRSPSNVSPMVLGAASQTTSPKLMNLSTHISAILANRKLKKDEKAKSRLDEDGKLLMNLTSSTIQKDAS